jgi:hypothetical protein
MKRHPTLYANDIQPINLCGNTVIWELKHNGIFEIPFDIKPTSGEHDFKACDKCQANIKELTDRLTKRFQGLSNIPAFPNCCENHKKLINYLEFIRSKDYFSCVPEMVAKKVIYMNQHIRNNISKENWFEEITYYMDWVVESFGSMPNDAGEPLYLGEFFSQIRHLTSTDDDLPNEKKIRIHEVINSYYTKSYSSDNDMRSLVKIYEKWIEIFPFKLKEYFGDLREQFEAKLPFFRNKVVINPYSGRTKIYIHSKKSLILYLNELTKVLIDKIDIQKLIEDGVIKDVNRHKINIEAERLNINTKELTKDLSQNEKAYIVTLKKWLELHKNFFQAITPLLETEVNMSIRSEKDIITDPL